MTYKPIVIPDTKQKRITIPKDLGLEAGKEVVILYLDDYNNLSPDTAYGLTKELEEAKAINEDLAEKLEEARDSNNRLSGLIEEANVKLAGYDKAKIRIAELETKLEDVTEIYVRTLEKVIATNENTSRDIIDKITGDYEEAINNFKFMDRIMNRLKVSIALDDYKKELKEDYTKQLEESKATIYLAEKIEDTGVIDIEEKKD